MQVISPHIELHTQLILKLLGISSMGLSASLGCSSCVSGLAFLKVLLIEVKEYRLSCLPLMEVVKGAGHFPHTVTYTSILVYHVCGEK